VSFAQSEVVQDLSKVVFGQKHRLAVMVAIARGDGIVNPGELAIELNFPAQSALQSPLRDLQQAGLITRVPQTAGKTYYRRKDSAAWAWALELLEQALRTSDVT
jgi:DNA-binding HxlR family transcriptional regulator